MSSLSANSPPLPSLARACAPTLGEGERAGGVGDTTPPQTQTRRRQARERGREWSCGRRSAGGRAAKSVSERAGAGERGRGRRQSGQERRGEERNERVSRLGSAALSSQFDSSPSALPCTTGPSEAGRGRTEAVWWYIVKSERVGVLVSPPPQ